jgi:hypothetical protein
VDAKGPAASPPHTIISVPVHIVESSERGDGVVASTRVGRQEFVAGLYRPPVLK